MFTYRNKTALITGASSGIGEQFAHDLAKRGMHLILVARTEAKLRTLAEELSATYGIRAEVIAADLVVSGAGQSVIAEVQRRGLTVDLLVNNAGFGTHGLFETLPLDRQRDEITLNITALVELTHAVLPLMLATRSGGIINVASTAAFQPDPYMAVYGATKAFVLSFSEALWVENRKRGVRVVALCPGATATAFFDALGTNDAAVGPKSRVEDVVTAGLDALDRGRSYVIPGQQNYLLAQLNRLMPRAVVPQIAGLMLRPKRRSLNPLKGSTSR